MKLQKRVFEQKEDDDDEDINLDWEIEDIEAELAKIDDTGD